MTIVAQDKDSDYSATWKWADDEPLSGAHVEFRKASTEKGEKVVWEIDADGFGHVSVWLDPTVLVKKVRAELERRQAERGVPRIEPGERVRINPGARHPSKHTPGQTVWPFPLVEFEYGVPEKSAEELLLADTPAADDEHEGDELEDVVEPAEEASAQTDDVPF